MAEEPSTTEIALGEKVIEEMVDAGQGSLTSMVMSTLLGVNEVVAP